MAKTATPIDPIRARPAAPYAKLSPVSGTFKSNGRFGIGDGSVGLVGSGSLDGSVGLMPGPCS